MIISLIRVHTRPWVVYHRDTFTVLQSEIVRSEVQKSVVNHCGNTDHFALQGSFLALKWHHSCTSGT